MFACARKLCLLALLCLPAAVALGQDTPPPPAVPNQNRVAAGKLENGVLTVRLELRRSPWHPEADNGPTLYPQLFGEEGKPSQVPGPLLRVPEGTTIHATVKNMLDKPAKLFGMNTRPSDPKASVDVEPGKSVELNFIAGAPGTYYYWARTATDLPQLPPLFEDALLNGALIVDAPGPVVPDRVFVIATMFGRSDVLSDGFESVAMNGKSYPYSEPLEYSMDDTIRWRVINPSFSYHPMHLHGAFYQVLSEGTATKDTLHAPNDRQSVVTENMPPQSTMMMEWKPSHPGRWLFHCHFHGHSGPEARVPLVLDNSDVANAAPAHDHDAIGVMHDMSGLVLLVNVKPGANAFAETPSNVPVHKLDLVIEPTVAQAKMPTFSCAVREGKKITASADKLMGPPIVVTRGEPVEITVLNHLKQPTTIHWHGIELESYYDGVMGGGLGDHVTQMIAPNDSFVARFTPVRAGTFIYHTHVGEAAQLVGGVYGPLIVLEPGETYDPVHDRVLVVGALEAGFEPTHLTVNGTQTPVFAPLNRGEKYRIRLINMGSDLTVDLQLGDKDHPAEWHGVGKDGAQLPARLAVNSDAKLTFSSGETYDFEFQPKAAGDVPLRVHYFVTDANLVSKFVVR